MKKRLLFIFPILILCILIVIYFVSVKPKTELCKFNQNSYDVKKAEANGDVVLIHGQITNIDRMDNFINDVSKNVNSKIRITSYTSEGGAIIQDLEFKNNKIYYTYDNSRDKYSSDKDRMIYKNTFKSIYTKKINNQTEYYLKKAFIKKLILTK